MPSHWIGLKPQCSSRRLLFYLSSGEGVGLWPGLIQCRAEIRIWVLWSQIPIGSPTINPIVEPLELPGVKIPVLGQKWLLGQKIYCYKCLWSSKGSSGERLSTAPASATGLNVEMIPEGSGSQTVGPGPAASETPGTVVRNANFQAPPQTHIIRKSGGGDQRSEF